MMMRKILRAAVLGASAMALAACGSGMSMMDDLPQKGFRTNSAGQSQGVSGDNGYGNHRNTTIVRSGEMANALELIDGIARAEVVMSGTNAYVGILLDEQADESAALGGSHARMSSSPEEFGMRGNYYGATDSRIFPGRERMSLEEAGTSRGARRMYGLTGPESPADIGGIAEHRSEGGGTVSRTKASSMTDAGSAAARGEVHRVDDVLLSQQVRARVESVIRSLEPNIRNVYVSSDPAVVERLSRAAAAGGDSVEEFNAWAARVFGAEDANRYDMHHGRSLGGGG